MKILKKELKYIQGFYQNEFRALFRTAVLAFGLLILIGFFVGLIFPNIADDFFNHFTREIQDSGIIQDDGTVSAISLFTNNLRASFYTVIYGFIPFIFLPSLSLGLNSLMLGFFASYYIHHGFPITQYILGILPHGVFELPALVIAVALGLYLCTQITNTLRHKAHKVMLSAISNSFRLFVFLIVPLLAVASIIEAYVTPFILSLIY